MSAFSTSGAWIGVFVCIIQSALFAGLNLAVFSLSLLRLQVEADGGNKDAIKVMALRRNANQVLATIIWGNVTTNVLLTLLSRIKAFGRMRVGMVLYAVLAGYAALIGYELHLLGWL